VPPIVTTLGTMLRRIWIHPANRRRRLRALAQFIEWQVYKRATGRARVIPFSGLALRCYPDSHATSAVYYFNGSPDHREMAFLRAYLRPGDGFIDVGANVGVYSVLAASIVLSQGFIDAFEPFARNAHRFRENMALNGLKNVTLHEAVAGAEPGTEGFVVGTNDCMGRVGTDEDSDTTLVQVPRVTLDEVCGSRAYAMGKMDVEGTELRVLTGAQTMLATGNPPVWQVELAGYSENYGVTSSETIAWLSEIGYATTVYNPQTRRLEETGTPWEFGVDNVHAVARSKWEEVHERLAETGA
jgi:FkbM family methyltransferase